MFGNIISKLKELLNKMGLIKDLSSITDHPDIASQEGMYREIQKWKALYKGYHKPFHDVKYHSLEGPKQRTMNTLHMGKISAAEMASLIYNEKCKISISDESVDEYIQSVLKANKFDKNFQDYLEYSFAMGGLVIKPYVEKYGPGNKDYKIMLSFVAADSFVPVSWKNGSIYEMVFPFEFKEKDRFYTHLEWHLWIDGIYTVKHELYRSETGDKLGIKVPLSTSEHTAQFAPETPIAAINRSLFVHIKPNVANNIDTDSPLGISMYANALDTLKTIDTAFDSFNREFRLGKKRILVPSAFVKTVVDPITGTRSRFFDASDETFEAFNSGMDGTEGIKDISTTLRVDEHVAGINALLNLYSMQTGFSAGTFSFDGQSMKTATEVISENSKTFKSKKSHEIIIEAALQELVGSIITLSELYQIFSSSNEYDVTVQFDDSIADDKTTTINQQTQLVMAKLQSRKRAIMDILNVTEKEAMDIINEINEEDARGFEKEANQESVLFGEQE